MANLWEFIVKGLTYDARFQAVLKGLDKERYTVAEAANIADVHVKTLRRHIKEGKIQATKPSERKTYILKNDLAAYLSRTHD